MTLRQCLFGGGQRPLARMYALPNKGHLGGSCHIPSERELFICALVVVDCWFTCTIVHLTQSPLAMDKGSGDEGNPEIECVADPSLFWEVHSISQREKER